MNNLTNLILFNTSIQELYNMFQRTGITDIEREVGRRLSNCDFETINFIYNNRLDSWLNSVYVRLGIESAFQCLPWRISVIYNYTDESYRINNINVILGEEFSKTNIGKRFVSTWEESSRSGLTMREIVSKNSKIVNAKISIRTIDTDLDNVIRQTLINSNSVTISICLFVPAINQSYERNLREFKTMYPCNISSSIINHPLITLPAGANLLNYNVKITKSEIFQKLLNLYILTRIKF